MRLQEAVEARIRALNAAITAELGISVSWGLATNKLIAGIASKLRKPRAFVVVPPGQEATFLLPLKVGKLPGIGAKTEQALSAAGLVTVADLLAEGNGGVIPRGPAVRVLDVGTGANLVYPLVGTQVYGWSFVGTEAQSVVSPGWQNCRLLT